MNPEDALITKVTPGMSVDEVDLREVDEMVARIGRRAEDLIPLLQAIQSKYNWLPPPHSSIWLRQLISRLMPLPESPLSIRSSGIIRLENTLFKPASEPHVMSAEGR